MTDNSLMVVHTGLLSPVASVDDALMRYQAVKDFIGKVLKEGTDYGKIPGAGDKPALLKPGAEKMCSFFGLTPRIIEAERVEDWTGQDHGGEPFFYYRYKIGLYRDDHLMAEGEGSANSWEKKYRYRHGQQVCPECNQPTIFKSKKSPEFYCWQKKGGCGATFPLTDARITSQEVGQVKNPDIADVVNTLQKMAQKRALMAPVLIATNTSDYFTQDIEDFVTGEWRDAPAVQSLPPGNRALYGDETVVSDSAMPSYLAYKQAHDGNPPENVYNLRNWYKSRSESSAISGEAEAQGE